jgi:hypothetical protein
MNPWTYDISPDRRQALIIDDEGYTVAEIAGHTDMTETVELMTAAPDMLKALTRTLDIAIGYACEARKCNRDECETWPWVQRARAAIFKATYTMEHKQ